MPPSIGNSIIKIYPSSYAGIIGLKTTTAAVTKQNNHYDLLSSITSAFAA
jgi:hypothetical protein